jgi:hypothetical protein
MEEDDASRLCTFPLKKLTSVLFNGVTYFSMMVFEALSSHSSFKGSYGVSPSSPNILSNSVATPTNF